jgi:hypothetical protein
MKKIFLGTFILSLFLLLSCKDNTMNNPVSPDQISPVQKSTDNIKSGVITLDRVLTVPGLTETSYQLNGTIDYSVDDFPAGLSTSTQKPDIGLQLSIDGKLYNPDDLKTDVWDVKGTSDEELHVSPEGILLLNKSYLVSGRKDGLELVCRFIVTTDGVGLNSVELSYADNQNN